MTDDAYVCPVCGERSVVPTLAAECCSPERLARRADRLKRDGRPIFDPHAEYADRDLW